jgi:hypothetical protein
MLTLLYEDGGFNFSVVSSEESRVGTFEETTR